jgi:hypothetical protein
MMIVHRPPLAAVRMATESGMLASTLTVQSAVSIPCPVCPSSMQTWHSRMYANQYWFVSHFRVGRDVADAVRNPVSLQDASDRDAKRRPRELDQGNHTC